MTIDHFCLSLQAAIDGLEVAIRPTTLIAEDLTSGRLVMLFPMVSLPVRRYYAYMPEQEPLNQNGQTFYDWLAAVAAGADANYL